MESRNLNPMKSGIDLMKSISILIALVLIGFSSSHAQSNEAQKTAQTPNQSAKQKPDSDPEAEEGEVDRLLKELKRKHEIVLGFCLTETPCESPKTRDFDGPDFEGKVEIGKAIAIPQPAYPPIARVAHVSGTVVIQVVVDETGKVIAAQALSGHPLLISESLKAAREFRMTPTTVNGTPYKVVGVVNYNFKL
jgi:TonB family protein